MCEDRHHSAGDGDVLGKGVHVVDDNVAHVCEQQQEQRHGELCAEDGSTTSTQFPVESIRGHAILDQILT